MNTSLGVALAAAILLAACSKDPGPGGRAELRGTLYEQRYNSSGNPTGASYPLVDQRVYIIYGDGTYADDDTRTGPNGEFRFPWLRKGTYKLYAISECLPQPTCYTAEYRTVSINDRKSLVDIGRITVANY